MTSLGIFAPLWIVVGGSLLCLILGTVPGFSKPSENRLPAALTVLAAIIALALGETVEGSFLGGTSVNDGLARIMDLLYLGIGAVVILASDRQLEQEGVREYEYFPLVLAAIFGLMVMTHGIDLITILIGLEIHSLSVYVLTASSRSRLGSGEGALKYFLLGAFASAFLIYGVALTYVATGSLHLTAIQTQLAAQGVSPLLAVAGALFVIGLAFKVSLVPFHWWTPDAYQGAPAPVTAFMSTATKAATFALLLRLLATSLGPVPGVAAALVLLGGLTIIVGNLLALPQLGIKRMLAYSSVAHAGYIAVALVGGAEAVQPILFYIAAYAATGLAGFVLVGLLQGGSDEDLGREQLRGLAQRHPAGAAGLLIVMLSLAGIPPTAGFAAKLGVFRVLVGADEIALAVLVVLTSAIAAYYYLGVIVQMYMVDPVEESTARLARNPGSRMAAAVAVLAVLALGLWPSVLTGPAGEGAVQAQGGAEAVELSVK